MQKQSTSLSVMPALGKLLTIIGFVVFVLSVLSQTFVSVAFTFGYGIGTRSVLDFILTAAACAVIGVVVGSIWAAITVAAVAFPQVLAAYLIQTSRRFETWNFVFFRHSVR